MIEILVRHDPCHIYVAPRSASPEAREPRRRLSESSTARRSSRQIAAARASRVTLPFSRHAQICVSLLWSHPGTLAQSSGLSPILRAMSNQHERLSLSYEQVA